MNRREVIAGAGTLALAAGLPGMAFAQTQVSKRPPKAERRFTSKAVEAEIARVKAKLEFAVHFRSTAHDLFRK